MEIKDRVKVARVFAGLSIAQLAQRLGMARANVIRWESDSKYNLPGTQVAHVAAATGVPAAFLEGRALEGLVIARPGRFVTLNAWGRTYAWVDEILSVLLPRDVKSISIHSAGRRYATIFFNKRLCLVVMASVERRPLTGGIRPVENLKIDDEFLLAAYDSDAGVDALLRAAGVTGFTAAAAGTVVTLRLGGGNKRVMVDRLLAFVEQMRLDGCDVQLEITDKSPDG